MDLLADDRPLDKDFQLAHHGRMVILNEDDIEAPLTDI